MSAIAFEKKQMSNGVNNPKYIDLLDGSTAKNFENLLAQYR